MVMLQKHSYPEYVNNKMFDNGGIIKVLPGLGTIEIRLGRVLFPINKSIRSCKEADDAGRG